MSGPSQALDERQRLADWCMTLPGLDWFRALLVTSRDLMDKSIAEGQAIIDAADAKIAAGVADGEDEEAAQVLLAEWEPIRQAFEDIAQFEFEDHRARRHPPEEIFATFAERAQRIRAAAAYWVSPDMVALTDAAYASRPQEPLRPDVVPPSGFVWLAQPSTLPAFTMGSMMTACAWHRDGFTDSAGRLRAGIRLIYWMPRDTLHEIAATSLTEGERLVPARWALLQDAVPFAEFWEFGQPSPSTPAADTALEHAAQWVHAFWVLSAQSMVVSEPGCVERAARRRAERAGVSGDVDCHHAPPDEERPPRGRGRTGLVAPLGGPRILAQPVVPEPRRAPGAVDRRLHQRPPGPAAAGEGACVRVEAITDRGLAKTVLLYARQAYADALIALERAVADHRIDLICLPLGQRPDGELNGPRRALLRVEIAERTHTQAVEDYAAHDMEEVHQ